MRQLVLITILFWVFDLYGQMTVEVGRTQTDYITISEVKNTTSRTEILLKFNPTKDLEGTLHAPSGKNPFVLSDQKGNRYALVSQAGWNGTETGGFGKRKMHAGLAFEVKLFFNKLPNVADIYSLTEVGCDHDGCWNFYDIKLVDDSASKPSASLDSLWVDYDVYDDNGRFGMKIHAKFTVHNMKNKQCFLSSRFQDEKDEFLKTTNTAFQNKSGQISLFQSITPIYDSALFHDQSVFMPYNEFKLPKGKYSLKYDVDILDKSGNLIKHLKLGNFTFTQN